MLLQFVSLLVLLSSPLLVQSYRASIQSKTCFPLYATVAGADLRPIYAQMKMKIRESVGSKISAASVPPQLVQTLDSFLDEYLDSNAEAGVNPEQCLTATQVLLKEVLTAFSSPHKFQPYHQAIRGPFDYYQWANDFFRPLVIADRSRLLGADNARKILDQLARGENVVMLSNHQTEADPQVLSILCEQEGLGELAERTIFIAGHKVTNDPVAIPYSMGRNLICIHSKKHIKNPPEQAPAKMQQNLESMAVLGELFAKGGHVFWVAPSGGRDRPDESDKFVVAPFDIKALDMFKLLAMQSGRPAHFYPMAMFSHQLVPPPKTVSSTLGEERTAKRGEVSVSLLEEMDGLGGLKDKEYHAELMRRVTVAYDELYDWHYNTAKK